jgi:hypothetical protein
MSCGCKSKNDLDGEKLNNGSNNSENLSSKLSENKIFTYSIRSLIFLFSIPITILVLPYIFWILFKTIVLSKDNNLISDLSKILPIRKKINDDDDSEEDDDELYDEEYGKDYDDVTENLVDVELVEETKKSLK